MTLCQYAARYVGRNCVGLIHFVQTSFYSHLFASEQTLLCSTDAEMQNFLTLAMHKINIIY